MVETPAPAGRSSTVSLSRCLRAQAQRLRRPAADSDRAFAAHRDVVLAGLAFDIVHVEVHGAAVAREEEARQRRGQHYRIAHRHVADCAADLVFAPRNRHHAHGAGKGRNVEVHLRGAVAAHGDEPRIECERRLRRRARLQLAAAVAAGAELAARALHAVDELAVEVANVGGEPALPEIEVVGRRRLVVGEIEDADVDRGDHDAGLLAGGEPVDLDRDAQRVVGPHQRRQLHVERERASLAVDREPLQADRAPRHALRPRIERAAQRSDDIAAAAPVAADAEADARDARRHVLRHRGDQAVAIDMKRDAPGGACGDGDRHGLARLVFRLVERDFEHVGRIGGRLRVPAGVERDRRGRSVRLAGRNLQPIAAPLHRQRRCGRACRRPRRSARRRRGGSA